MRALAKVILTLTCIAVLSISVFLFVFGTIHLASLTNNEYPQVYIRSNGNIEVRAINSSSVPISCDGNLYTLNADMELQKLFVEKSNIILDGNGFSIKIVGPGGYKTDFNLGHFEVSNVENVTLRNLTLTTTHLTFEGCSSCKAVNNSGFLFIIKNCRDIFISENTRGGVELIDSTNCTISSSVQTVTLKNSHNNKILNNNMTTTKVLALRIEDSSNNLFFGNSIERTHKLFEIVGNSGNNLFVGNFVQGAFSYDPTLNCSGINTFYHNNFVYVYWNKTLTTNTPNMWDNGSEGNYWNDYQGVDANSDGVGDYPHLLDANNQDRYPLTKPVDLSSEPQPQTLP
jgi:nitrous oxidase accessory protein